MLSVWASACGLWSVICEQLLLWRAFLEMEYRNAAQKLYLGRSRLHRLDLWIQPPDQLKIGIREKDWAQCQPDISEARLIWGSWIPLAIPRGGRRPESHRRFWGLVTQTLRWLSVYGHCPHGGTCLLYRFSRNFFFPQSTTVKFNVAHRSAPVITARALELKAM